MALYTSCSRQTFRVDTFSAFVSKDDIVRPAMLKLDVQGFEMQALAGCESLIDNFDYVYCECSFVELYKVQKLAKDVILYLGKLGFGLSGIYNAAYDRDGNCIQADLLFTPLWSTSGGMVRLTQAQVDNIRNSAIEVFGAGVQVWLFGSRVDDSKRGGDIDLLVRPVAPSASSSLLNKLFF